MPATLKTLRSERSHNHVAIAGVHCLTDLFVNWFLVEDGSDLTVIDAGLPSSWKTFVGALEALGHRATDVKALVLTHGHFDHVGFAERARSELGVPIWVHRKDAYLAHHPLSYKHERSPALYLWRPSTMRILTSLAAGGALWPRSIREVNTFDDGDHLDVPGAPRIVPTPGHTAGHCC